MAQKPRIAACETLRMPSVMTKRLLKKAASARVDGDAAEEDREPGAGGIGLDEDLLRRVDVAHQRAEDTPIASV